MISRHFILVDGQPVLSNDTLTWAQWFQNHDADRIVAQTMLGESKVSTVFLGLDHQFEPDGPPLIYETLVFGGTYDQKMDRYSTPEEARAGHEAMVARVNLARAAAFAFAESDS